MNAENFSEWQRRQRHKVIRTKSSYWYEEPRHIIQAFPCHWVITPSEREIRDLMLKNRIIALRYSTTLESTIGKISYHIVQNTPPDIKKIRRVTQKQIGKGLSSCKIRQVSMACLATEGWELQQDTLIRQGRKKCMCQENWRSLCESAEGIPGFETWGAYVDDELAACLLSVKIDDTCQVLYSLSQQKYFHLFVNHALFYYFTQEKFNEEGIKSVFFTVQSLDAPKSVDDFKFRMGFQPISVRQRVVFHPLLRPFVNKVSHNFVCLFLGWFPDSPILPKAEGMIRFYLEGRMPAEKQEIPDCVDLQKINNFQPRI
jgi:hypothetical protein